MGRLPTDETIKRWVSKKGLKKFEEEINYRLEKIEVDYTKKKEKLLHILGRLKYV